MLSYKTDNTYFETSYYIWEDSNKSKLLLCEVIKSSLNSMTIGCHSVQNLSSSWFVFKNENFKILSSLIVHVSSLCV
jgi:hypothetical protein